MHYFFLAILIFTKHFNEENLMKGDIPPIAPHPWRSRVYCDKIIVCTLFHAHSSGLCFTLEKQSYHELKWITKTINLYVNNSVIVATQSKWRHPHICPSKSKYFIYTVNCYLTYLNYKNFFPLFFLDFHSVYRF